MVTRAVKSESEKSIRAGVLNPSSLRSRAVSVPQFLTPSNGKITVLEGHLEKMPKACLPFICNSCPRNYSGLEEGNPGAVWSTATSKEELVASWSCIFQTALHIRARHLYFCFRALQTFLGIIYLMDEVQNLIFFLNPSSWCSEDPC